ncbi:MAG TPA: hypothetical protein VE326_08620, partial [Candidatus Binatia bacterium]|nr:hypothetical protein [Candidatus Binatia bacterium]
MVELEEPSRGAPMPIGADERALPSVPVPYRATDTRRDVPWPEGRARPPRALGARLPPFELRDQSIEGAVEHLGHVSRGNGVAEQRLRAPQLVVG